MDKLKKSADSVYTVLAYSVYIVVALVVGLILNGYYLQVLGVFTMYYVFIIDQFDKLENMMKKYADENKLSYKIVYDEVTEYVKNKAT